MRLRVAGLVALAVIALAAAATVPALARPASDGPAAAETRPVPVDLLGMLAGVCFDGLVFPDNVTVALEPVGDDGVRFVLSRNSESDVDPTAFPIVDFTPEEESFRETLEACLAEHPVSRSQSVPDAEAVEGAIYQDYRERRLLPCLATHGVAVIEPTSLASDAGPYDWYVLSLYQLTSLDQAVGTWYDCPVLPDYLDGD